MRDPERHAAVIARFRELYAVSSPFREDRAHLDELALEVAPVIDTIFSAVSAGLEDPSSRSECLAMLTLLGRRAGTLGLTPTAGLAVVHSLIEGLTGAGVALPPDLLRQFTDMAFEGYVAGREDRSVEQHYEQLALAHQPVRIAPKVVALVVTGEMDAPRLGQLVESFGRTLLRTEAVAAVVDIAGLRGPAPDRASEIFGADATARMLGAQCIFSSVSDEWRAAAKEGRVTLEVLRIVPTFTDALDAALTRAGLVIRPKWSLAQLFGPK